MQLSLFIVFEQSVLMYFRFVSQGKNPDRFTKDFLENTARRNEKTKGKIHYLKVYFLSLIY